MDMSKILFILCCCALAVCLVLSITALTGLRNAVAESGLIHKEAVGLVDRLNVHLEDLQGEDAEDALPTVGDASDAEHDNGYVIRACNGKIAVLTSNGYPVRTVDVLVLALPPADREALQQGIRVDSLQEVDAVLQDYTS